MDPNNSFEMFVPKIEEDVIDLGCRVSRPTWNSETTMKLIETLEAECQVLWNVKHAFHKDKTARQSKTEYLADMFGTTAEEINRKIHNLRTQYNNELRKLKKKQEAAGLDRSLGLASGWEYFEAMSFLKPVPSLTDTSLMSIDPLDTSSSMSVSSSLGVEAVNIALAEFQAEEEQEFAAARARPSSPTSGSPGRKKPTLRVAASAPLPLSPRALPIMWPEQPRIQPSLNADECQIFGDFVASELRTLRSESRRKLKRMIQKAILQVGEEEDININGL